MYTESPYITIREVLFVLKSNEIRLSEVEISSISHNISWHNKYVNDDIKKVLSSMNSLLLFNHEKLLKEITSEIENGINSELDDSSGYSSDDWEALQLKRDNRGKTIRKYKRDSDYFTIIGDKVEYIVPSLKNETIKFTKEQSQMAFQAIYFGDILPDNYDKVKQIWLKTGKGMLTMKHQMNFILILAIIKQKIQ